jgi:glyoxylase-like metal-dependent hydrolase (beta-lactamase superfamily II)
MRSPSKLQKLPDLTVHVIGEGKGESIILELPNGKWGVIDCYANSIRDESTNQTLNFLKRRNAKALEFLCLSHPHEDHFRGITHLLNAYEGAIEEFWRFPVRPLGNVIAYLHAVAEEDANDTTTEDNEDNHILRSSVAELTKMFQIIGDWRRDGNINVRQTEDFKCLYSEQIEWEENGAQLKIFSLAPAGNLVDHDSC